MGETPKPPPQALDGEGRNGLGSRAAGAMATLALLVAVPYAAPKLARLRVLTPLPDGAGLFASTPAAAPSATVGEARLLLETTEQSELRQPEEVPIPPAAKES